MCVCVRKCACVHMEVIFSLGNLPIGSFRALAARPPGCIVASTGSMTGFFISSFHLLSCWNPFVLLVILYLCLLVKVELSHFCYGQIVLAFLQGPFCPVTLWLTSRTQGGTKELTQGDTKKLTQRANTKIASQWNGVPTSCSTQPKPLLFLGISGSSNAFLGNWGGGGRGAGIFNMDFSFLGLSKAWTLPSSLSVMAGSLLWSHSSYFITDPGSEDGGGEDGWGQSVNPMRCGLWASISGEHWDNWSLLCCVQLWIGSLKLFCWIRLSSTFTVRTSLDSLGKQSWSLQPKPLISDKCHKWSAFESNYTAVTKKPQHGSISFCCC